MSKEEALRKLKKIKRYSDKEVAHIEADEVLCDLLKTLGYSDVVEQYNSFEKYYI